LSLFLLLYIVRHSRVSILFPYTTLFRSERLSSIYSLQKKHQVTTVNELIEIQEGLRQKLEETQSLDENLERMKLEIDTKYKAIRDRKSRRLNSSHVKISYAVFCLKKKKK